MISPIQALTLPQAALKLTKSNEILNVWCILRKKKIILTPEEWVRQHWVHFLIHHLGFPEGLIVLEKSLKINGLSKRCDIVVYNTDKKPVLIVECKEPKVKIDEKVFFQIANYNSSLQVDFLILSNGLTHFVGKVDYKNANFILQNEFPTFQDL